MRIRSGTFLLVLCLHVALIWNATQCANAADLLQALTAVDEDRLRAPPDGDWLMWRRTYNDWGYSPLAQVDKSNVKDLRLAWSWSLTSGVTQITPLVHDGVLFIVNAGDKVQALDAATGDLLWQYQRDLPPDLPVGGITLAKRNMAIFGDTLFIATSDVHLVALNAKTGEVVWDHQVAEWKAGWRYTSGPFVAGGILTAGMSGCGQGQPGGCFITGHDPKTGAELWRFHTIAQPGDPNEETWNGLPVGDRFGGSAWIAGSYDPETDTLFYGTAQPYPWNAEVRGTLPKKAAFQNGALYTNSTLAIEPKSGRIKWYHQHLANDSLDLDEVFEKILVDLPVDGQIRKTLVTVGKLGIIDVLDRTNGKFLWSRETVPQNVVSAIDPASGARTLNPEAVPHIGKTTFNCPADPGARGWPATAYSPRTGALYLPLTDFCSQTTPIPIEPGKTYRGGGQTTYRRVPVPNSDGKFGRMDAFDLTGRSQLWSTRSRAPMTSAALPTAGGLVFAGSLDRYFRAYDDKSGKILWEARLNNVVNAFPISYSVNGKQYIAIAAGGGGIQIRSLSTLTPESKLPEGGAVLWVFALP
ncbi:MAG: hypothetical protein JWP25_1597 [Bradyrhizobium sp.]|jgi:alcohol dehydrogenase (cytochrome c)|nr:hypothetical protein [Bradyrhizobium sp.]